MTLHLWQHWFWITSLKVLMTLTVITQAEDGTTSSRLLANASHPLSSSSSTPVRLKLNVTRLYLVPHPDNVPDTQTTSQEDDNLNKTTQQPIGFSSQNMSSPQASFPFDASVPSTSSSQVPSGRALGTPSSNPEFSSFSNGRHLMSDIAPTVETPTGDEDDIVSQTQSERLEREIRKNVTIQSFKVDIKLHPSYEPNSDGLEHDKLSHHTQDFVRKISTTLDPIESDGEPLEHDYPPSTEVDYTVYVTPQPSSQSSSVVSNDLTTTSKSVPVHFEEDIIEVVKKSDNVSSKFKDKPELKPKYSSKLKADKEAVKTSILKPSANISKISSENDTSLSLNGNIPSSEDEVSKVNAFTKSVPSVSESPSSSMMPPPAVQNSTHPSLSSDDVVHLSSSVRSMSGYELMNDSPELLENSTSSSTAVESTSVSVDYEELNTTFSSNKSTDPQPSGRMLDVATPESVTEGSQNSWVYGRPMDMAMISGISFAAVVMITLLGAVSFVVYRRYRWNKPQTLSDKCSNPDSSGYIDDSTLRENSEEMYSLDNDSFLNSLEAMTIQNYWTDHVKHTKL